MYVNIQGSIGHSAMGLDTPFTGIGYSMADMASFSPVGNPSTMPPSSFSKNDQRNRTPRGKKTSATPADSHLPTTAILTPTSYLPYLNCNSPGQLLPLEYVWYAGLSPREVINCMVRRADSRPELVNLSMRSYGAPVRGVPILSNPGPNSSKPFSKWAVCPYNGCGFANKATSQLNRHRRGKHGELVWLCPDCHSGYQRRDAWVEHLNARPRKCKDASPCSAHKRQRQL
jgi:hypothetical protein